MADIRSKAIANGTYMKAPNGEKSNLNEAQWLHVRTKSFKEWFGDWENYFKKQFLLNGDSVSNLIGNEFSRIEGKTLTDQVSEYFDSIGNKAISPLYGEVILDRNGVDDSLGHGMGRKKAIAYAAVKDVIEKGILLDYDKNHKDRGYDSAVIAAPIKIGGDTYVCSVIITRKEDNRFYLHEVIEQKKLSENASKPVQQEHLPKAFAKIYKNIISASDNVSKIIDENGEPKVVYHGGTLTNVFDFSKSWSKEPYIYTTNVKEEADVYAEGKGGKTKALFVNIKNPHIINTETPNYIEIYKKEAFQKFKGIDTAPINFYEKGLKVIEKEPVNKNPKYWKKVEFKGDLFSVWSRENVIQQYFPSAKMYQWKDKYDGSVNENEVNIDYNGYTYTLYDVGKTNAVSHRTARLAHEKGAKNVYTQSLFQGQIQKALDNGNDGVVFEDILDLHTELDDSQQRIADQYVAFNPNQIKSATINLGTYSKEENDIRYAIESNEQTAPTPQTSQQKDITTQALEHTIDVMGVHGKEVYNIAGMKEEDVFNPNNPLHIIGEKGAEALDALEQVTTRLDNLNLAKSMESFFEMDAKSIKLTTGWEKGKDGKWRYEISDIKIKEDFIEKT